MVYPILTNYLILTNQTPDSKYMVIGSTGVTMHSSTLRILIMSTTIQVLKFPVEIIKKIIKEKLYEKSKLLNMLNELNEFNYKLLRTMLQIIIIKKSLFIS